MSFREQIVQLVQAIDVVNATIPANGNTSNKIPANGLRGLAVIVPPAWTAANIAFYGVNGDTIVPLFDEEGALVVISSIATGVSRLYIAPPSVWALGALPQFMIASVDTTTGALTVQSAARELKVAFLR